MISSAAPGRLGNPHESEFVGFFQDGVPLASDKFGYPTIYYLPPAQRITRFLLLYKELDADDGELTRTRKVRRAIIAEKYADLVDALYGGAERVSTETEVT